MKVCAARDRRHAGEAAAAGGRELRADGVQRRGVDGKVAVRSFWQGLCVKKSSASCGLRLAGPFFAMAQE